MKLRIKEIAEALDLDSSDILATCAMLNIPATSRISSLTINDAKRVTDYYQEKNNVIKI